MAKKAKAVVEPVEIDDEDDESGPVPPGQLGDWQAVLPKEVQEAVDKYVELMRESNSLREQKNAAKEACIEAMSNHAIDRVKIDEGGKYSWIKAPRWRGHAMEVGPLARYIIGYTQNNAEFKEPVEATEFIRKADHYDKATIVTFKADESQAKVTP